MMKKETLAMAETLDIDGEPEGTDGGKKGASDPGTAKRDPKEKSVVVDENDQPLGADDDGNTSKRDLSISARHS